MEMSSSLVRSKSLSRRVASEVYALAGLEQGPLVGGGLYQQRGLSVVMGRSEPEK
jgi:hypothetical protein